MIANLDNIKANINIVDLISHFLPLYKEGVNYKTCCPFHSEKTPSFIVSPNKNIYHCFGCGNGGDAIKFIMEYKRLNFSEAIEEIANILNLNIEKTQNAIYEKRQNALAFLNALNEYFKANLTDEKIINYLFKRGLNEGDFAKFDIGFVGLNENIINFCKNNLKIALELGIINQTQRGLYCPFSNRISFAIRDKSYKVVGFSSRIHDYFNFKNSPKYINSKESFIFKKSFLLYNLANIRTEFLKTNEVIIVEGFFDAIALSKFNFSSVASLGTAFNENHLALLLKTNPNAKISLCFDEDTAGLKATLKTCELLFKNRLFNVRVLKLVNENCKDIGDILQYGLSPNFKEENAFEFYIKTRLLNIKDAKAKGDFINALKNSVNKIDNFYLKDELLTTISKVCNIKKDNLYLKQNLISNNNFKLESLIFKKALSDEKSLYLVKSYLNESDFNELKEDYTLFLQGSLSDKAKAILFKEETPLLSEEELKNAIKALIKQNLNKDLEKAKLNKDFNQILLLKQKIIALT
ncbi:DNA primase [Campylobacter sp. LR291e]|uniref:DNA primase n=1 Tax=Campylobacter sp. LR291e TaxID=2593546 RepID=UPI00123A98C2|nr:DNA primase [Campylobacter sp. LR291e]KAA6231201.1 DNA primase [Campylobacter sp. LR291e]